MATTATRFLSFFLLALLLPLAPAMQRGGEHETGDAGMPYAAIFTQLEGVTQQRWFTLGYVSCSLRIFWSLMTFMQLLQKRARRATEEEEEDRAAAGTPGEESPLREFSRVTGISLSGFLGSFKVRRDRYFWFHPSKIGVRGEEDCGWRKESDVTKALKVLETGTEESLREVHKNLDAWEQSAGLERIVQSDPDALMEERVIRLLERCDAELQQHQVQGTSPPEEIFTRQRQLVAAAAQLIKRYPSLSTPVAQLREWWRSCSVPQRWPGKAASAVEPSLARTGWHIVAHITDPVLLEGVNHFAVTALFETAAAAADAEGAHTDKGSGSSGGAGGGDRNGFCESKADAATPDAALQAAADAAARAARSAPAAAVGGRAEDEPSRRVLAQRKAAMASFGMLLVVTGLVAVHPVHGFVPGRLGALFVAVFPEWTVSTIVYVLWSLALKDGLLWLVDGPSITYRFVCVRANCGVSGVRVRAGCLLSLSCPGCARVCVDEGGTGTFHAGTVVYCCCC